MIIDLTKFVYIWATNDHDPRELQDSNIAKIVKHIALGHTVTLILTDNVPNKEGIQKILSEFDYTGRIKILSYETKIKNPLINQDILNENIATFLSFIDAELTHEKGAAIAAADMIRLLLRAADIEGVYVDFDTALVLSSDTLKDIDIDFIITSKYDKVLLNLNNDILYLPHDLESKCREKILETVQNQETDSYNYENLINDRPNKDQLSDWLSHIAIHSGPGIISALMEKYLAEHENLLKSAKLAANKCNIIFPVNHVNKDSEKPTFSPEEILDIHQILGKLSDILNFDSTLSKDSRNSLETLETYDKFMGYLSKKPEIDTDHLNQLKTAINNTPLGRISDLVNDKCTDSPSFPVLRGTGHTSNPNDDNFERLLYRRLPDVAVTEDLNLEDELTKAKATLKTANSNDRPEDNGEKDNEPTNNTVEGDNKSTSNSAYSAEKTPHNDIKEEEDSNDQPYIFTATKPIDDNIIGCTTPDDDGDDDSSKLPAYAALNNENKFKVESVYLDQKVSEVQAKINSHLEYEYDLLITNQAFKKQEFDDIHPLYEYAEKCNIAVELKAHPNDDSYKFIGNANIETLLHDNTEDISVIGKTLASFLSH